MKDYHISPTPAIPPRHLPDSPLNPVALASRSSREDADILIQDVAEPVLLHL